MKTVLIIIMSPMMQCINCTLPVRRTLQAKELRKINDKTLLQFSNRKANNI